MVDRNVVAERALAISLASFWMGVSIQEVSFIKSERFVIQSCSLLADSLFDDKFSLNDDTFGGLWGGTMESINKDLEKTQRQRGDRKTLSDKDVVERVKYVAEALVYAGIFSAQEGNAGVVKSMPLLSVVAGELYFSIALGEDEESQRSLDLVKRFLDGMQLAMMADKHVTNKPASLGNFISA